jgi:transcriptional regulator with XRE-family HTH domain
MPHFGDVLRTHRSRNGWRQSDLAEQIGTNQTQVSKWETGQEPFESWAISNFFDKLLVLFGYQKDLLDWWADHELARIEAALAAAHLYVSRSPHSTENRHWS